VIPRRCEQTTEPQDVITHIEEAEVGCVRVLLITKHATGQPMSLKA